jgi:hypothetical protein
VYNPLHWENIKYEIYKSSKITDTTPLCLIIVALHLGPQILKTLGKEKSILLSEGNWFNLLMLLTNRYFSKGELKENGSQNDLKFSIPERMELVILGPEGMKEFLGETNFNALCEFKKNRNVANMYDSLFPTLSISDEKLEKDFGQLSLKGKPSIYNSL